MRDLKIAIIGLGNIGLSHAKHILSGEIAGLQLVAVCARSAEKAENFPNIPFYSDYHKLLDDHIADAVLITTPHYDHPAIAIEAFQKGYHVLCEKPSGVYTKAVRQMNEEAEKSGKVFSLMLNQRTDPMYRKVRDLIAEGAIGTPHRLIWILTDWYRTQAYYDCCHWRGTWAGEGGGVLMNQGIHQLDLWQWFMGMPQSITAHCPTGKYHHIEVEDEATVFAKYENGATATFIITTGEYPGTNRLEIAGSQGKIVVENNILRLTRLEKPTTETIFESAYVNTQAAAALPAATEEFRFDNRNAGHVAILQNFTNAVLNGEPLIAPGEEGIHNLTLCNAAYLSHWTGKEVQLPLDEDLYYNLLQQHIS
jgi:predicted dehydrogenase